MRLLRGLWTDESGQDLSEYALLLVLLGVALLGVITALRTQIMATFDRVGGVLQSANDAS